MTFCGVSGSARVKSGPRNSYCCDRHGFTEGCQGPEHLGETPCMECGGGVADEINRICVNCADQRYRKMREAALGRAIVYTTERPRTYLL